MTSVRKSFEVPSAAQQVTLGQVKPNQAKPDQVKPNQVKPNGDEFVQSAAPRSLLSLSSGAGVPAAGSYPNSSEVKRISDIQDPVARNYAITQGYSDLSEALGGLLGKENANWATFGAWASKQAGSSIRKEDVPQVLRDLLNKAEGPAKALDQVNGVLRKLGIPTIPLPEIINGANAALDAMSQAVADGNRIVFAEIGGEFAKFVDTFKGDTQYNQAKVDAYLAHFTPEQKGLRDAFSNYAKAMFEKDPKAKAELMFLGNAQVGAHEQARLQPHIERAMKSPDAVFRDVMKSTIDSAINALPWHLKIPAKLAQKAGLVDKAMEPLLGQMSQAFRRVATETMMKLNVPGESLRLGSDLPPPPGQTSQFPLDLQHIDNPELRALLSKMDRTPDSLNGSGANDWSNYDQRMHYILDLFRSRQQQPSLFDPPFGRRGSYATTLRAA